MNPDRISYLNDINSFLSASKSCLSNVLSKLNWSEESLLTSGKNINATDRVTFNSSISVSGNEIESKSVNPASESLLNLVDLPVKKEKKEKTLIEILAQRRDLKRRRTSYKGRIHTKHKSQIEIMREVIAQQMESLEESNECSFNEDNIDDVKVTNDLKFVHDLSGLYSPNPHLAWKYVRKEVENHEKEKIRFKRECSEVSRKSGGSRHSDKRNKDYERRRRDRSRSKHVKSERGHHKSKIKDEYHGGTKEMECNEESFDKSTKVGNGHDEVSDTNSLKKETSSSKHDNHDEPFSERDKNRPGEIDSSHKKRSKKKKDSERESERRRKKKKKRSRSRDRKKRRSRSKCKNV